MPAANKRFGATAAGRADLKGSAGKPPLRQAAIPLAASGEDAVEKSVRENCIGENTSRKLAETLVELKVE